MSKFTESVNHYCEGLSVSVGCRGIDCEHADGDENHQCEANFSSQQCDSCGSMLAGDRLEAWGISHEKNSKGNLDYIQMDICIDCAMYHANGDEPCEA